MLVASIALAVLAVLLAWPIPLWLSGSTWPTRAPGYALLLWQAIALAGGLSMIGALLTFGLVPFCDTLARASIGLFRSIFQPPYVTDVPVIYVFALSAAVLLGGHLVLNLILTVALTERQRQRHRQLVQLLSSPVPELPHTRLIDNEAPVAYCLPGTPNSITVYSAGLISLLSDRQLAGVIAHEKAHLLQRHHIVVMVFDAWRTSLPWFPIATRAQREVSTLVEMLADDRALREVAAIDLAGAVALVEKAAAVRGQTGGGAAASDSAQAEQVLARLTRLRDGRAPLRNAARAVVAVAAVALVAVPTILLFAPTFAAA